MKSIVETLTAQHRLLESLTGEIHSSLLQGDTGGIQRHLPRLHQALNAYLELESGRFYPALVAMARARGEKGLLNVAVIFQQSMQVIAAGVQRFFDRYEGKPVELAAFRKDWDSLVQILTQRIGDEEEVLHPIHARLTADEDAQPMEAELIS